MDKSSAQSSTPTNPQQFEFTEEIAFDALTAIQEENRKTDVITVYGGHPPRFPSKRYREQLKRQLRYRRGAFKKFLKRHYRITYGIIFIKSLIITALIFWILHFFV